MEGFDLELHAAGADEDDDDIVYRTLQATLLYEHRLLSPGFVEFWKLLPSIATPQLPNLRPLSIWFTGIYSCIGGEWHS